MTKPHSKPRTLRADLIPAKCRQCGRIFGMISFQDWKRGVGTMHGVVCPACGRRADARTAKPTLPDPE